MPLFSKGLRKKVVHAVWREGKGEGRSNGIRSNCFSSLRFSRQLADNSSTTTVVAPVLLLTLPHYQHHRCTKYDDQPTRVYPYVVAEVIACLSARLNYVSACPAAGGKFRPPFCGAQHNVPRIFFFYDGNLTAVALTETCLSMNYWLCFNEKKALCSITSSFDIKYM